jgi:transposase InsO family protein
MKDEPIPVEKKNTPLPPRGDARRAKKSPHQRRYPFELKLKAVRLYLEEGFSGALIAQETGVSQQALSGWVQLYRQFGQEGLKAHTPAAKRTAKLPPAVTAKIIALKKDNPSWGIKTIAQWLRRTLFLQASPETVRQKLHEAQLMSPPAASRKRNLTRPRFFERATPNQMWQSDIFTFRLGGRYAYVVAFLDDYSRFIVGADLFRSPTAEAVIEVYRQAIAEFKPPKEMLTDNGRQYTSWRGTSRFEAELKKDGVAHFKSRPQHPMTLGKVERFWETLWQQFLTRAQFASFEDARERIRFWIRHYNHKRPNQGIGGLCPADRFFEIQTQLRQTIEAGIKENLLEMALRGQPRAPFYMVGRMEGQSVVLRAEKGKLKLELSDSQNNTQELTYDLDQKQQSQPGQEQQTTQTTPENQPFLQRDGESPGGAGGVDGALQGGGSLPPDEHPRHDLLPLAAAGHGGNAPGTGEPGQPFQGRSVEPQIADAPEPSRRSSALDGQTPGANPACLAQGSGRTTLSDEPLPTPSHSHSAGAGGPADGRTGGPTAGPLPPALLHLGEARPQGDALGRGGSTHGTSQGEVGPGKAIVAEPGKGTGSPGPTLPGEGTAAPEVQRDTGPA